MMLYTGETWDEQLQSLAASIVDHFSSGSKKQPDYTKLARAALASKPPRATDLPAHLEFCKKWGGGNDQFFTLDICQYIKMKQGARIVNGSLFDVLNKISFACDEICPSFIAAVVKTAATRGPSRSGVSIHITEGDAKSIASKRLSLAKAQMVL